MPDNMTINEDGDIEVITADGETLIYTRNEDGTYTIPTQTVQGSNMTIRDQDGNVRHVEEGEIIDKESIQQLAQWHKDNSEEILAERAEEAARHKEELDRITAETMAFLEKERAINSQADTKLAQEIRKLDAETANWAYMEEMRWKYAPNNPDITKEELLNVMKREHLKELVDNGEAHLKAANAEERLVNLQEAKFYIDSTVNIYGMVTKDQRFSNTYAALTNYAEAFSDAKINNKDMKISMLKATGQTLIDLAVNEAENHNYQISANALGGAIKQVIENAAEGRDLSEGVKDAALFSAAMGAIGKAAGKMGEMSQGTGLDVDIFGGKPKVDIDGPKVKLDGDVDVNIKSRGIDQTSIAERRLGKGTEKLDMSDADIKMRINDDVQGAKAMDEVRKLNTISEKMDAIEHSNPRGYKNDPEYQKLAKDFDVQAREVREHKGSVDRLNALEGDTGKNLLTRYTNSDKAYSDEVLRYRNESIAAEKGLSPDQIGDINVTSNKGLKASHDTDTSPYIMTSDGRKIDFTQTDGDYHLAKAVYKAEHGRYPSNAAEYEEALRLKQVRDFTNVSTRPSDTQNSYRNPDAYVGSGKGDVNKVLNPEKYGTPEKGTGYFNEQTAIHKQGTPLERHQQQYAEAERLRSQLDNAKHLTTEQRAQIEQKISYLEYQSSSNHYESVRTTAKEFNVISRINDVNIKNGLGDGLSDDVRFIGKLANEVATGQRDVASYKAIVTKHFGSEENALKLVAEGFRTTNK